MSGQHIQIDPPCARKVIFLDMDGVLVDTPILKEYVHYQILDSGWWRRMDASKHYNDIMYIVEDHDWYILSHPCSADCCKGKWQWLLDRDIPTEKIIFTQSKHLLSNGGLLLDDSILNINNWSGPKIHWAGDLDKALTMLASFCESS